MDAHGERCPTYQQAVDFDLAGPGLWRGGYNSGRTNSVNQTTLELECGINRVAVRSTAVAGPVTVTVHGAGLPSASVTVSSEKLALQNGYALNRPPLPALPALVRPTGEVQLAPVIPGNKVDAGRYLVSFSYSGPAAAVRVRQAAKDGAKIYADRDFVFAGLPARLQEADWVQTANADKLYSAVDLLDFAVNVEATVYVAHDRRLPEPDWLSHLFKATAMTLDINHQSMKIYERHVHSGESLTLGSNTEDRRLTACNMYVVFFKRTDGELSAAR